MIRERQPAYVWVTWIAKLLVGEAKCQWAAWFKAHYAFQKLPPTLDTRAWAARHTELVREAVSELKGSGYEVAVEDQNAFRLRKGEIVLAGRPDIVATSQANVMVVDCKSGMPRLYHHAQALVYMAAIPWVKAAYRDRTVLGRLWYSDHLVDLSPEELSQDFLSELALTIRTVGGTKALLRFPSIHECNQCDIPGDHCPDRQSTEVPTLTAHDLF
jgi:hypothetical protein